MAGGKKKKKKKTVREIIERAFFLSLSKVAFSEGAFLLLLLFFFPVGQNQKARHFRRRVVNTLFFLPPRIAQNLSSSSDRVCVRGVVRGVRDRFSFL